jgi:hypothetical protein
MTSYHSFRPGQPWLDTEGKRIHAHGGSVFHEGGTFYWYGENKEHTRPGGEIRTWGVRCYSSRDLYNWEDRGLIIPPDLDDEDSPLHPKGRQLDRPHIIYNAATGKYVCWMKIMSGMLQQSTILTADSFLGPYTIQHRDVRPFGMNAGDFDLAVHPRDGKGYYIFGRVHSEVIVADLTDDYTNVTGYYSTHFPLIRPPFNREAPAFFSRHGMHYLITSGTTSYFPNPSEIASAATYHGPWTVLGDPHPEDDSRTSYRTQISSVFRHPDKEDLYIALGDRWAPQLAPEDSNFEAQYDRKYQPGSNVELHLPQVDVSLADYVWLPIRFDGRVPTIDWRDEWSLDEFARAG